MRQREFGQIFSAAAALMILTNIIVIYLLVSEKQYFQNDDSSRSKEEIVGLTREKRDVPLESSTSGGAIFVRWGRTQCPPDNELVYAGVAGGSDRLEEGGGGNYLCLPVDPIFGKFIKGAEGNKGLVHGAEYQFYNEDGKSSFSKQNAEETYDHNVPCAVCRSTTHSTVLMIPARNECYKGWQMEYDGYLVSAYHAHKGKTEFVCMDADPEADPAGYRNENGALFYQVEGVCGSLPCPPYDTGKELTCVMCSK